MKLFLSEVCFTDIGELWDSRWNVEAIVILSVTFIYSQTFKLSLGLACKEPCAQSSAIIFEPPPLPLLSLVSKFIAIQIDFIFTDIT